MQGKKKKEENEREESGRRGRTCIKEGRKGNMRKKTMKYKGKKEL